MTVEYAAELAAHIREHDWVTFAGIAAWLDDHGVPTAGDSSLAAGDTNLVLWAGMSPEMVSVVVALRDHGITVEDGSVLAYLIDGGGVLNLPLAKRIPKGGYRTPHWVPTYFRPVEKATPTSDQAGPGQETQPAP